MNLLNDQTHFWNSVNQTFRMARKEVLVASFGLYIPEASWLSGVIDALERGVKVRFLLGVPEPSSMEAIRQLASIRNRWEKLEEMLGALRRRVEMRAGVSHAKLVMSESYAILGGRNFSTSTWPDFSLAVPYEGNARLFGDLRTKFDGYWDLAVTRDEFLKGTKLSYESMVDDAVDEILRRRSE